MREPATRYQAPSGIGSSGRNTPTPAGVRFAVPGRPRDLLGSHSLVNANLALKLNDGIRLEAYVTNLGNVLYAAGTLGDDAALGARHGSSVCGSAMTIEVSKTTERPPRAWLWILTFAIILLSLTLLIVTGVFFPPFHSWALSVPFRVFPIASHRPGGPCGVVACVYSLVGAPWKVGGDRWSTERARGLGRRRSADSPGDGCSWRGGVHLMVAAPPPDRHRPNGLADETALYATVGGQKLYTDIYLPDRRIHPFSVASGIHDARGRLRQGQPQ